ncbi:MAG: hypothetical protein U0163_00910 [Gemmatimonadaceae bacterium]
MPGVTRAVAIGVSVLVAITSLGQASALGAQDTSATRPATVTSAAPPQGNVGWAHVTYLSGPSVYLDAGTKQGIKIGTHLQVLRGSTLVAELVAEYVSSNRTSCTVARALQTIAVGDSARYTPARIDEPVASTAAGTGTPGATTPSRRSASRPIRGRVGVRYLHIDPGLGQGSVINQPAFDIRLDGHQLSGTPLGLTVDIRAYRAGSSRSTTGPTNVTRVYQSALELSGASGSRLAVGRQFSSALSTIGLFDGASLDVDRNRWGIGGIMGTQPEPVGFGLSGAVREYGGYIQLHNARNTSPLWSNTLGAIGSYNKGEIDREFAYVQSVFNARVLSFYAAQEVDFNRGWKKEVEGKSAVPTSTFALMRVSLTNDFSINAGYDNRRSVRLYRDFITPEVAFDDAFRRGVWGGASLTMFNRVRMSVDTRQSSGGSSGRTQSTTGVFGVSRLTPLQLGFHGRYTTYTGDVAVGSLSSGSIEMSPFGTLHLEGSTGVRKDKQASADTWSPPITWQELNADVGIGRSLYLLLSAYQELGTLNKSRQTYIALSYRF